MGVTIVRQKMIRNLMIIVGVLLGIVLIILGIIGRSRREIEWNRCFQMAGKD